MVLTPWPVPASKRWEVGVVVNGVDINLRRPQMGSPSMPCMSSFAGSCNSRCNESIPPLFPPLHFGRR